MTRRRRRQAAQSMVEFALVAPILVLVFFGVLDFGRAVLAYIQISQAVGEAARAAALAPDTLPTNDTVLSAANTGSTGYITLAACPNDAVPSSPSGSQVPAGGAAFLYIDDPTGANANSDGANAPGGQTSAGVGCGTVVAARSDTKDQLSVTIVYNFQPFTPLISRFTGSQFLITSTSVIPVEY